METGHWIMLVLFAVLALAIFLDSAGEDDEEDEDE